MDTATLQAFLLRCTIINMALLLLSALSTALAGNLIYRVHGRMYSLSREEFNRVMYMLMGFYKILILVFNVVPYLALRLL